MNGSLVQTSDERTQHYSHFFQRKSIYGPIAEQAISVIARG
jgi:hypothetical protein